MKSRRPNPTDWAPERFWGYVERGPECWEWRGPMYVKDGYGRYNRDYGSYYAHRAAYEIAVGPIPNDLELDHLCRNRRCVRPDHLELVTHRENLRRGEGIAGRARWIACAKGHAFSAANTHIDKRGTRRCRTCARLAKPSGLERPNATFTIERRRRISEAVRAWHATRERSWRGA